MGVVRDHTERLRADREPAAVPEPRRARRGRRRAGPGLASPHHEFWLCEVSLVDEQVINRTRVHGPRQVIDAYLLALAVGRGGRFVTFERSVVLSAVSGATPAHLTVLQLAGHLTP